MNDARRAYQETAVHGAKPVRLTILLYEQIIQDVNHAAEAISARNFEAVASEVSHATGVIGYLQATLRREKGVGVVRNLSNFYTMLREKLMEAQVRCSREILDHLRENMIEVREAWLKVEADSDHVSG
jgi:flagellar secretion chaperone FliS